MAAWAWIPIVIWAAFAQTIRNAAQRTLTSELGTLPATLVRFLIGAWNVVLAQALHTATGLFDGDCAGLAAVQCGGHHGRTGFHRVAHRVCHASCG